MLEFFRALESRFCPAPPLPRFERTLRAELRISAREAACGLRLSSKAERATATFGDVLRCRIFIKLVPPAPPQVVLIVLPPAVAIGLGVRSRCLL